MGKTTATEATERKELYRIKRLLSFSKKRQTQLKYASEAANSKIFNELNKANPIVANFFRSRVRNLKKKPIGRRFSFEDKVLALALFKQSGKGYKLLSKLFALPSWKTLTSLMNKVCLKPGINTSIYRHSKRTSSKLKANEKYCTLMFDEMALHQEIH